MAMLMRSELAYPGQQVVNDELYNQLFTMHGTIMLLLFATPLFFDFGEETGPPPLWRDRPAMPDLSGRQHQRTERLRARPWCPWRADLQTHQRRDHLSPKPGS